MYYNFSFYTNKIHDPSETQIKLFENLICEKKIKRNE